MSKPETQILRPGIRPPDASMEDPSATFDGKKTGLGTGDLSSWSPLAREKTDSYIPRLLSSELFVGQPYSIEAEIARGGMAIVYSGWDHRLKRRVAIKVLQKQDRQNIELANRFVEEAQIMGALQHPYIPAIHEVGLMADGQPFLAMKLIQGSNLEQILSKRSSIIEDRSNHYSIFLQVCQAVAFAHQNRIIHRDLKPSNIMVGAFGEVQVMDWGLAKLIQDSVSEPLRETVSLPQLSSKKSSLNLTEAGSFLGTPSFVPPEQARGQASIADTRADVFGLGGILSCILTGQPPYTGQSWEEVCTKALAGNLQECYERLDKCDAEPDWIELARECLHPDKEFRPTDAGKVAERVCHILQSAATRQEEVRLQAEKAKILADEEAKRRRLQSILFSTVAVVVVIVLGFYFDEQLEKQEKAAAQRLALEEKQRNQKEAIRDFERLQEQIHKLSQQGLWQESLAILQSQGPRLIEMAKTKLAQQYQEILEKTQFEAQLDAIRSGKYMWKGDRLPKKEANDKYRSFFTSQRLDFISDEPDILAQIVRNHKCQSSIIEAIDDWCADEQDRSLCRKLLYISWLVTEDPLRQLPFFEEDDASRSLFLAEIQQANASPSLFLLASYRLEQQGYSPLRMLERACTLHPNAAWLQLRYAMIIDDTLKGDDDKNRDLAIAQYRAILSLRPNLYAALNNLARLLMIKKEYALARELLERAIAVEPKEKKALHNLAVIELNQLNWAKAEACLRQVLSFDTQDSYSIEHLGLALLSQQKEEGIQWLERAFASGQHTSQGYYLLAQYYHQQERYPEAISYYRSFINSPALSLNLIALADYAEALWSMGQRREALEFAKSKFQSLSIQPLMTFIESATPYVESLPEELLQTQQQCQRDPADYQLRIDLIECLLKYKFYCSAMVQCRIACRLNPEDQKPALLLITSLFGQGRNTEAELLVQRKLEDEKLANRFTWLLWKSELAFVNNRYYQAEQALRQASTVRTKNDIYPQLPNMFVQLSDDYPFAIYQQILERQLPAYPDRPDIYFQLALCCMKREQYKQALAYGKTGLSLDSNHPFGNYIMGLICKSSNLNQQALSYFELSAKNPPLRAYAHGQMSEINMYSGNYTKVEQNSAVELKRHPDFEFALITLASAKYRLGKYTEALQLMEQSLQLSKTPKQLVDMVLYAFPLGDWEKIESCLLGLETKDISANWKNHKRKLYQRIRFLDEKRKLPRYDYSVYLADPLSVEALWYLAGMPGKFTLTESAWFASVLQVMNRFDPEVCFSLLRRWSQACTSPAPGEPLAQEEVDHLLQVSLQLCRKMFQIYRKESEDFPNSQHINYLWITPLLFDPALEPLRLWARQNAENNALAGDFHELLQQVQSMYHAHNKDKPADLER